MMILLLLHAAVLLSCGHAADLARFHDYGSAEQIPAERHTAAHGPQADAGDFHGDPYGAYPGLGFGPMGPVVRSVLPNDPATLPRSLSSAAASGGDDAGKKDSPQQPVVRSSGGADDAATAVLAKADEHPPKTEYHIISVEFPRVETPFLIGIWIFFASLAKIGMCTLRRELNLIFLE